MTDTLTRTSSGDQSQRAFRAVREMHKLLPIIQSVGRAMTGVPDLTIQVTAGTPRTNGKIVYLQVPIELGDIFAHDRANCSRRDSKSHPVCSACRQREKVLEVLFHELAHIIYDSFQHIEESDKDRLLERMLDEHPAAAGTRLAKLQARADEVRQLAPWEVNYMGLAAQISPFLPTIINALEDARVNRAMYEVRAGTFHMFRSKLISVFEEGIETLDGTTFHWSNEDENAQAIIGCLCKASGVEPEEGYLSAPVLAAMADPALSAEIAGLERGALTAADIYRASFHVLEHLRRLGFCLRPDDVQDDPPPPEPEPQPEPEQQEDQDEQEADQPADPGESEETDQMDEGESDSESESGDSSGDDVSSGDGSDSDQSDDEPDDESGDDEPDESDDESGDEESDDESGDEESDSPEGTESEAGSDDESVDGEADDEDDAEASDDPLDGGEDEDENSSESSGSDVDSSLEDDEADDTETQSGDDDQDGDEEPEYDPDDDWSPHDDPDILNDDNEPDEGDYQDDDDLTDVLDDDDNDADQAMAAGRMDNSDPDDVDKIVELFLGRDADIDPDEAQRMAIAITQAEQFDEASGTVNRVNVHHFDQPSHRSENLAWGIHSADKNSRYDSYEWGKPEDFEVPESMLGATLLKMRTIFADNKKSKRSGEMRSGRVVNTRLASVMTGNAKVFNRTQLPHKKDYFVCLALDVSGSTAGSDRLNNIKKMGFALGNLLSRSGVKFAIYAHTGSRLPDTGDGGDYFEADVFVVKEENDPWDEKAKYALAVMNSSGGNLDGHALEFFRKRCDRSTATDKVLLYVTDGAMPEANKYDEREVLVREIRECDKRRYSLIGVGIGTDSPRRHGLDTIRVDNTSDIAKLVHEMEKRLAVKR